MYNCLPFISEAIFELLGSNVGLCVIFYLLVDFLKEFLLENVLKFHFSKIEWIYIFAILSRFLNSLALLLVGHLDQTNGSCFKIFLNISVRILEAQTVILNLILIFINERNTKRILLVNFMIRFQSFNVHRLRVNYFCIFRTAEVGSVHIDALICLNRALKTRLSKRILIIAETSTMLSNIWVMDKLFNFELIVPDAITLGMLGMIKDIICWFDDASMDLFSLRLLWCHSLLLIENLINLLKRTHLVVYTISGKVLLISGILEIDAADRHRASPDIIISSSSPSRHFLKFIKLQTCLLRSNL